TYLFSRDHSSIGSRPGYRRSSKFRPYHGGVRCCVDGRRKYSWRDPHRLHQYLRQSAGCELQRRQYDVAFVAAAFVRRADDRLWVESQTLGFRKSQRFASSRKCARLSQYNPTVRCKPASQSASALTHRAFHSMSSSPPSPASLFFLVHLEQGRP